MLLVDTTRPIVPVGAQQPAKHVLERFGFTDSRKGIALRVAHQANDANRLSAVLFSPPCQVVECGWVEFDRAATRNLSESDYVWGKMWLQWRCGYWD